MMRLLLASTALICSGCALADEPIVASPVPAVLREAPTSAQLWRNVGAETGEVRDIAGLEQLARDFPDSGNVRLRLLQPLLAAGEVEQVMDTLEWLYDRGYVFSDVAQTQIPKLLEGVDPGRIAERLRAKPEVIGSSEVIATFPASAGLLETVIRFPENIQLNMTPRPKFLATAVMDKHVTALFSSGNVIHFDNTGADNVSGMVWDEDRQSLWIASSNIDGSEKEESSYSGLYRMVNVAEGRQEIPAPEGVNPSDITVGPDGTLYASDPIAGGVYKASLEQERLVPLVPMGTFRSPQGLVTSEDNTKLYVSDYRYGIAIIDLDSGGVARLASDIPIIMDGVDAMWRHGKELIVVQNGTSPMRISAFELSDDGNRVVGHRVLEQANPEWTEPLSGSIDGDALIYVGTGQWDRYVDGKPAQDKPTVETQIRRLQIKP
ncbi:MAG: hypothetical protein ABJ239_11260 [Erythrobacter sp.]